MREPTARSKLKICETVNVCGGFDDDGEYLAKGCQCSREKTHRALCVGAARRAHNKAHSSISHMTDKSDTLPAARLQELARTIDPKLNLEPDAEKVVQDVLDDFVENLASFACELAVHRSSTTLEARDIQLALGTFIFS